MNELQGVWGIVVGIIGLLVAFFAIFQDTFKFVKEWNQSEDLLKKLVVNRWAQFTVIFILASLFFWMQFQSDRNLKETVVDQEAMLILQEQKESPSSSGIQNTESTTAVPLPIFESTRVVISAASSISPVNVQIDSVQLDTSIIRQPDTLIIDVETRNIEERTGSAAIGLSFLGPTVTIDIPWETVEYDSLESIPVQFEINLDGEEPLGEYTIVVATWLLCDENISGIDKCLEPNYARVKIPGAFKIVE